ncbi:MAG: M28 family peptidase [Candidatus Eisenbacteria bacterium]|uniref:M28 family peptidase n=1 Tax=Eiseniibacteriota bacterium TaxID=2212470 RepID=A0A937XDV1_UNCEI|nr:M28 family peptidase [Candidatus Eisenbacteria bacterium]
MGAAAAAPGAPAVGAAAAAPGAPAAYRACSAAAIEADVRYFADDRLEGRGLGSPGLEEALRAVARRFADLGLEPPPSSAGRGEAGLAGAGDGDPLEAYLQPFTPPGHPPTANVIGLLPGAAERTPRAIVLGAHIDHLGRDTTLAGDQIYNGADDNASGVAALLAVAEVLAGRAPGDRDRAVVFAVFSGEELGRLGSRHFVEHPVVPNDELLAMVNLDTVGRLRDGRLYALGSATAREFPALLAGLNQSAGFDLVLSEEGTTGSDQASFLERGIPVLHFFTGPHEDYHRVTDEAERIDFAGLAAISDHVAELIRYLRYRDRPFTFVPACAETRRRAEALVGAPPRRVSLGFMPDFAGDSGGVKVAAVSPGGAAEKAGIRPGDVVVAIDGELVGTLVEYTAALRGHAPGERVRVSLDRGGEPLDLEVEVQERK